MQDLVSDQDRERFVNQLEDTAGTFRTNQDEDLFEDENGFYLESMNLFSQQNIKVKNSKSEEIKQEFEINKKDENMMSQIYNQSPSIQSNDRNSSNQNVQQQFEQNLMRTFSVGNTGRICKLLIKIEQKLIKCFQLKGESLMNKLYESQIQKEQDKQNIIVQTNENKFNQQSIQSNERSLQYDTNQKVDINDQEMQINKQ